MCHNGTAVGETIQNYKFKGLNPATGMGERKQQKNKFKEDYIYHISEFNFAVFSPGPSGGIRTFEFKVMNCFSYYCAIVTRPAVGRTLGILYGLKKNIVINTFNTNYNKLECLSLSISTTLV